MFLDGKAKHCKADTSSQNNLRLNSILKEIKINWIIGGKWEELNKSLKWFHRSYRRKTKKYLKIKGITNVGLLSYQNGMDSCHLKQCGYHSTSGRWVKQCKLCGSRPYHFKCLMLIKGISHINQKTKADSVSVLEPFYHYLERK